MKKIFLKITALSFFIALLSSCNEDFLDTKLESTFNNQQLSTSSTGLSGIVDGIYTNLHSYGLANAAGHLDYGHKSILSGLDMMSNDMYMTRFHWYGYFYNWQGRVQASSRTKLIWNTYYPVIKSANSVINNIDVSKADKETKAVLGQALTLRALSYFMLARVFGPTYIGHENDLCIPVYKKSTFDGKERAKVSEVYDLITSDLTEAIKYLEGYVRPSKEKMDQSVAEAIIANVFLEKGDYVNAAMYAHKAREKYPVLTKEQYLDGFYDLEKEPDVLWGAIITPENTTFVVSFFAHFDNTNKGGYAGGLQIYKSIDKRLYDSIPATDYRKQVFVGLSGDSKYPDLPPYANVKFIDPTGDSGDYVYMRAAEMYYVEAEALARQGNDVNAQKVLYEITSKRDTAYKQSTKTGKDLIKEIILQKRIELWGEGCAWFDMKRLHVGLERDYSGTNQPSFGTKINIPANSEKFLFQIPQAEIDTNKKIVQNPL